MSCQQCGRTTSRRFCVHCERSKRRENDSIAAPESPPECPTCGGPTSGTDVECANCRRDDDAELVTDGGSDYGETYACPHCDATGNSLRLRSKRSTDSPRQDDSSKRWYCVECEEPVDVIRRERQATTGPNEGSLGALLEQADPDDIATDGGRAIERWARQDVDAVRTHAGVADQDNTCENGTEGCPGPDAAVGGLPCSACFLAGGEADD